MNDEDAGVLVNRFRFCCVAEAFRLSLRLTPM